MGQSIYAWKTLPFRILCPPAFQDRLVSCNRHSWRSGYQSPLITVPCMKIRDRILPGWRH